MDNPAHSFRDINHALQLELKVKLWWAGSRERKKRAFFITFISFEGHFFNICVLSQCIVYWINFQNIYVYFYLPKNITPYTFVACF